MDHLRYSEAIHVLNQLAFPLLLESIVDSDLFMTSNNITQALLSHLSNHFHSTLATCPQDTKELCNKREALLALKKGLLSTLLNIKN